VPTQLGAVELEFSAPLWLHSGDTGWVFATLPADLADEILVIAPRIGGFGSVPVEVTIGATTWRTSLFPDNRRGSYLLPVKRAVREANHLGVGDEVAVSFRLLSSSDPPRVNRGRA